ncbi:c-type cytochrome [Gallaecimonas sp. GXIMD4217]|uniref:c-type cytochrome n=1 Tax=Gallaecimonas sp. GXIMD4217 TaxID=3131927 RepID=UPI00311AD788
MKNIALALTLLAGFAGSAMAQGDAEAGKAKAATCAACHGGDGNSAIAMYPKLAGQHASYLEKQLIDLKLGMTSGGKEGRYDPAMSPMTMALSEQDMADLAAFFASQSMKPGATPEEVVEKGAKLYRGGDIERGLTACIACHGPRGEGHSLAKYPKISGQYPEYIKGQLEKFRSGTRTNDPNGMMVDIAKKLTDEDIAILSKYLAGLH